jgi:hypothetical protein
MSNELEYSGYTQNINPSAGPTVPQTTSPIQDSNKKDINPSRGKPTDFLANKYNIEQLQYPQDLYSNNLEYGGNYVIFYINVAEDSRILKNAKQGVDYIDPKDVPSRLRGMNSEQQFNSAQAVSGAATSAGVKGVIAGGVLSADAISKKGIVGVAKGAAKGGAVGVGLGTATAGTVAIAAGGKMARQQKRLTKAIALHIPNALSNRYSMQWDAEDTAVFQMGAVAGTEVVKALGTLGTKSNASGAIGNIMTSLALSKGPEGAALSSASGLAANPKKENLFKSVDFRTFTFDYSFFPKNPTEAEYIRNIIKQFKLHMHPEYKDSNGFLLVYPSEFDIFYYNNGKENLNLHRHTSCVLTEMNINYTPNSMFNSFANGMPTQINITMTFKELSMLTKKEIEDGF